MLKQEYVTLIVDNRIQAKKYIDFEIKRCETQIKIINKIIKYEQEQKIKVKKMLKELNYLKEEM